MTVNTQRLKALQEQVARKKHLEAVVEDLREQQKTLSEKTQLLHTAMMLEQKDVERLEGKSLASMFYEILGKKADKLEKERREAYAARLKYDAAARELETVEHSLRKNEAELMQLQNAPKEYEAELQEVLEQIKASEDPKGETIHEIQLQIGELDELLKELQEAIDAGETALKTANQVKAHLDSAEDWGTWDLFGGGLLADMAKYDELDNAQAAVSRLQAQLRTFKTELVDVTVESDIEVTIDGFTGFADWFFDGLLADWAAMDRISGSIGQINRTRRQLQEVLERLTSMQKAALQERDACRAELERIASEG